MIHVNLNIGSTGGCYISNTPITKDIQTDMSITNNIGMSLLDARAKGLLKDDSKPMRIDDNTDNDIIMIDPNDSDETFFRSTW